MNERPSTEGSRHGLAEMIASELGGCLILVRHGQTTWNAERRLQGQKDVPLNEHGWHQCRAIARQLEHLPIETIHCSVLARCLDTAKEISKKNIHRPLVVPSPLLKEMALGSLEGELKDEQTSQLARRHYEQLCADEINYRVPGGGESLRDVGRRVARFFEVGRTLLEGALLPSAAAAVVIVAHRNVNKMIVGHLLGLSLESAFRVEHENHQVYLFFPKSKKLWSCWIEGSDYRLAPGFATTAEIYA